MVLEQLPRRNLNIVIAATGAETSGFNEEILIYFLESSGFFYNI